MKFAKHLGLLPVALSMAVASAALSADADIPPTKGSTANASTHTAQSDPMTATETAKKPMPNTDLVATHSKVHFVTPKNGATVGQTFKVKFAVEGMTVEKAGPVKPGTGHHHLLIDSEAVPAGQVVPKDATHLHFGDGKTETELKLPPGKHTLTLQFADGAHASYGPEYSSTITVNVK